MHRIITSAKVSDSNIDYTNQLRGVVRGRWPRRTALKIKSNKLNP